VRPRDFKSLASTSFAMSANGRQRVTEQRRNTQGRGASIAFLIKVPRRLTYPDGDEQYSQDLFDKEHQGNQFLLH